MPARRDENAVFWILVRNYQKKILEDTLANFGNSPKRAAEVLGLNPATVHRMIKKLGVERPEEEPQEPEGEAKE